MSHMSVYTLLFAFCSLLTRAKLNQLVFVDAKDAIAFVDPLRQGFRVVLGEHFLSTQIVPQVRRCDNSSNWRAESADNLCDCRAAVGYQ